MPWNRLKLLYVQPLISKHLRACLNLYDADFERTCQMDFCLRRVSVALATRPGSKQKDAVKDFKSKVI